MTKPLVTFFVCAYNQERFVREAVEGAFAQTYEPLQIILSDDCSRDRTFDIMHELAADYRGPHTITLNRNENNLGIGAHVNRIVELSAGEIIVGSAGDDISLPERTEVSVRTFQESDGRAMSVYSAVRVIDEDGNIVGRMAIPLQPRAKTDLLYRIAQQAPSVMGTSHAFRRVVFDEFGPLGSDVISEDRAIAFRSYELGNVVFVDQELVKYRTHANNVSGICEFASDKEHKRRCLGTAAMVKASFSQFQRDLEHPRFANSYSSNTLLKAKNLARRNATTAKVEIEFIDSHRLRRLKLILGGVLAGVPIRKALIWTVRTAMPDHWYYLYCQKRSLQMRSSAITSAAHK